MDRETRMDQRSLVAITGGAMLIASVLGRPSAARRWAAVVGVACMAAGCVSHSGSRRVTDMLQRLLRPGASRHDDAIDQASLDSFPASDPPASIPASEPRA
jgi:hypothetical protein